VSVPIDPAELMRATMMVSAVIALWTARRVRRHQVAGGTALAWLLVAVGCWCITSTVHGLVESLPAKLVWAKIQYVAISTVGPLWLLFATQYAGTTWFAAPRTAAAEATGGKGTRIRAGHAARIAMWIIPAATIVLAVTNEWHRVLWTSVATTSSGAAIYAHGWWFFVAAAYNYALILAGTLLIARTLRRSPPAFRAQLFALIAACMVPWGGNMLYIAGWGPAPGIDVTPLGFAASVLLIAWTLHRNDLFDLVPVARDLVIDSLSDAMIVIDPSLRILDMNSAARELAMRKAAVTTHKGRWVGREVDSVFPLLKNTMLETTAVVSTSEIIMTAGEPAYFDIRMLPVRRRGRALGVWVIMLRDVTVERRAAAERDALQLRMQEQQRREGLSILASGLAHEFNNLLAGVVGNADLLAMEVPASSSMGSSVGAILLNAQRAADLVSKMLAYAGERHGSSARIDVDAMTRDLLDLVRASAGRHCTMTYDGQPALIDADPTQFRQVAMNLIINAAEAVSDAGQISISTGTQVLTTTELSAMRFGEGAAPGPYAFLAVQDNGVGMDERTLARLFQPFFTTKTNGGLGLAAVQGIVRGHRGALQVDSQPGVGSRFCVWFPLAESSHGEGDSRGGAGDRGKGTAPNPVPVKGDAESVPAFARVNAS
jgi:signal transduction histidine kinase